MITIRIGNIFESGAEALVNPVNCRGVMGAGLALEFKKRFPYNFAVYKKACDDGGVKLYRMFVTEDVATTPRLIINFPTKDSPFQSSNYQYIENGLRDLIHVVEEYHVKSIAIPALGCGLGGLSWPLVKHLIFNELKYIEDRDVTVYAPARDDV